MKKYLLSIMLAGGLNLAVYAGEIYNLEPTHSFVEFHYNHMGFSNPSGKWFATGNLNLDAKSLAKSSADITIKIGDIVTGVDKLNEHLKGPDFFDVAKYPTATFVSQKISNIHGKKFDLTGTLTLHGVSKPVTLHVTQNEWAVSKITNVKTAGFSATATIKRSDYGLSMYVPAVSDEVKLNIEIEAQLADNAKKSS